MAVPIDDLLPLGTHPGEFLRQHLRRRKLSQKIAAGLLGMSRMNLNRIITGHRGISATTAMRLSRILPDTDAAYWMTRQNHYDLFAAGKGTKGR